MGGEEGVPGKKAAFTGKKKSVRDLYIKKMVARYVFKKKSIVKQESQNASGKRGLRDCRSWLDCTADFHGTGAETMTTQSKRGRKETRQEGWFANLLTACGTSRMEGHSRRTLRDPRDWWKRKCEHVERSWSKP